MGESNRLWAMCKYSFIDLFGIGPLKRRPTDSPAKITIWPTFCDNYWTAWTAIIINCRSSHSTTFPAKNSIKSANQIKSNQITTARSHLWNTWITRPWTPRCTRASRWLPGSWRCSTGRASRDTWRRWDRWRWWKGWEVMAKIIEHPGGSLKIMVTAWNSIYIYIYGHGCRYIYWVGSTLWQSNVAGWNIHFICNGNIIYICPCTFFQQAALD